MEEWPLPRELIRLSRPPKIGRFPRKQGDLVAQNGRIAGADGDGAVSWTYFVLFWSYYLLFRVSKQYLDLYKRNFVLVFELLKHDVMDLILAEEDEEIESNMSHSHNPANHDNEFELKMRMRGCYLRYVNYQNFVDAFCNGNFKPKKLIN